MGRPPQPAGFSRSSSSSTDTQWYGVCLTVWTAADDERAKKLKILQAKLKKLAEVGNSVYGFEDGLMLGKGSTATLTPLARMSQASLALSPKPRSRKPSALRVGVMSGYSSAGGDDTDSVVSESDFEGPFGRQRGAGQRSQLHQSFVGEDLEEEAEALFEPGQERFGIPYALTLVSKYPIYDILSDFLKLSWARFSKDSNSHRM